MGKMLIIWIILGTLLALFLFNYYCCERQVQCEDVSHNERYAHLIGQKYKSIKELSIHGILAPEDYNKKEQEIAYYTITEKPGIGGRYVISRNYLKNNTLMQVKKVSHCEYLFDPNIVLEIAISSEEKYSDHSVEIGGPQIEIIKYKNNEANINPELFEPVPD